MMATSMPLLQSAPKLKLQSQYHILGVPPFHILHNNSFAFLNDTMLRCVASQLNWNQHIWLYRTSACCCFYLQCEVLAQLVISPLFAQNSYYLRCFTDHYNHRQQQHPTASLTICLLLDKRGQFQCIRNQVKF